MYSAKSSNGASFGQHHCRTATTPRPIALIGRHGGLIIPATPKSLLTDSPIGAHRRALARHANLSGFVHSCSL